MLYQRQKLNKQSNNTHAEIYGKDSPYHTIVEEWSAEFRRGRNNI